MKAILRHSILLCSLILLVTCSKDSSEGGKSPEEQVQYSLNVTISPQEGGTVLPSQSKYNKGQEVTLTASPASGYQFKNWTGAANATQNTVDLTMDSNKNITAVFEEIIDSETFIISEEQWAESLINIDTTNYTLVFNKSILTNSPLETGDIIISTSDGGLLRRIKTVSENDEKVIVETDFATIAEAFEDLDEENNFAITPDTESKDYWLSDGVTISSKIEGDIFPLSINETLKDPENSATAIDITGTYDLEVNVDGAIKVKKPKLKYFDLTYEINQSKDITALFVSNGVFEKERKIANIPCGDYPIGPIIISPTIELYVGVNASIEGSLELGLTETLTNSSNLNYDGEKWTYNDTSSEEFTFSPVDFKIAADAKVYIKPQITFKIYKVVGPYVNVELYGRAEASLTDDFLDYKACLGADIDMGVKMDIFEAEIFDFAVDVFEYEECPIEDQITFFDEDEDGVSDELDQCPNTAQGQEVDSDGCPITQTGELVVITKEPTNITPGGATLIGEVTTDGGMAILDHGFYISYSENEIPSETQFSEEIKLGEGGVGQFSADYSVPELGVISSYRAFAKTNEGIYLGEVLTVGYSSEAPQVIIDQPANNSTFNLGESITISGTVSLPEPNTIFEFGEVYIDGVFYQDFSNPTFSIDWNSNGSSIGSHTIEVIATDNLLETGILSIEIVLTENISSERFSVRQGHGSVVFNNKIWVIGGRGNGYKNDVWHSSDGVNWTEATSSANFTPREGHTTTVFQNKIWVIGGYVRGPSYANDVWYSSDGINWIEATSSADFSIRGFHTTTLYDNKIWVIGGRGNGYKNDVWHSSDGVNWTEATSSANFTPRERHTTTVFDDKLFLISGYNTGNFYSNVWSSTDGVNWAIESSAPYSGGGHTSLVYDNKLWNIGGLQSSNRVFYSNDGINWVTATSSAAWTKRGHHTSVVFNDKMWVIGGYELFSTFYNEVWSSSDGINWKEQ